MVSQTCSFIIKSMFLYCNKKIIKKLLVNITYSLLIQTINVYNYLKTIIITLCFSRLISLQTFTYRSSINNLDFDITEYLCSFNQRFYKVRFVDLNDKQIHMDNFSINIKSKIDDRNLIFHSSIQKDGMFIKDVTEDLRSFFHYINSDGNCSSKEYIYKLRNSNLWKYIRLNIGLDDNYELLVCLNDILMTDIIIK